ncbi:hypothetical protein HQQ81_04780 [Microbacteriaceae bacterium VKM Ac-2854]|nr:hypothetical protein [Microbacteriaceae bacterium VKM Ac-2854]
MNNTNRGLNRVFIFLFGLVLLLAGAAAAAVALVQPIRDAVTAVVPDVPATVSQVLQSAPIGDTGTSWSSIAALAVLLLVVVLLLIFMIRQGNGHTGELHVDTKTGTGTTVIDTAVAEDALQDVLTDRPEFVSSHVSSYDVRGTAVLKISITARRGVSPKDVAAIVEDALHALDRLVGTRIPALLQISGGFRSRVTSSTRLQ